MSFKRDVETTAFAVSVLRHMGHHPAYLRITVGEKPYIVLPGDEEECLDLCRFFGTHRIRRQKYELHSLGCRIVFSPSITPADSPDLDGQFDELREFIDAAAAVGCPTVEAVVHPGKRETIPTVEGDYSDLTTLDTPMSIPFFMRSVPTN